MRTTTSSPMPLAPTDLQAEEGPLDEEVVREAIALTPEWWRSVVIEVSFSAEDGVERYSHVITSPEGHREPVTPSDALFDLTYRLGALFKKHGRHWKTVTYRIEVPEDGPATYVANFRY